MNANPLLGLLFHWLGGLAAASFYIPYRGVKRWSWETYWLVGGFFAWIVTPLVFAFCLVPDVAGVWKAASGESVMWVYLWGVLWGLGGVSFGLTMRYLGIALGMAITLGYCAAFGTLVPPIFKGELLTIISQAPGQVILAGVLLCLSGIAVCGLAGMSKEKELSEREKKLAIKEFNFFKGILVATFSGVLSASFSYGLSAGEPIAAIALGHLSANAKSDLWQNLPVLVIVTCGGFTTNLLWCGYLNIRNHSTREYLALRREEIAEARATEDMPPQETEPFTAPNDAGGLLLAQTGTATRTRLVRVPILSNYLLSMAAGVTWYMQFFFYSMGETRMGAYKFSSWTLHMASIIIFSTFWGVALREWKGTRRRTHVLVAIGLVILILSTLVVGYGNYLKTQTGGPA